MRRFGHRWKPADAGQLSSAGRSRVQVLQKQKQFWLCGHGIAPVFEAIASERELILFLKPEITSRLSVGPNSHVQFSLKMSMNDKQCLTHDKFEIVFQTTFASQSSKCDAINKCVANVNRQMRRKRLIVEPRVQTIKAKQDIWTGGPESLGAHWMTETGKHAELHAFFPIGHLMELVHEFASSLDVSEK
jgi:hypothetical protein